VKTRQDVFSRGIISHGDISQGDISYKDISGGEFPAGARLFREFFYPPRQLD